MISWDPKFYCGFLIGCHYLAGQESGSGRYPVTSSSFNLGTLAPTCQQSFRNQHLCRCRPSSRLRCGTKGMRFPSNLAFQCCPFVQLSGRVSSWLVQSAFNFQWDWCFVNEVEAVMIPNWYDPTTWNLRTPPPFACLMHLAELSCNDPSKLSRPTGALCQQSQSEDSSAALVFLGFGWNMDGVLTWRTGQKSGFLFTPALTCFQKGSVTKGPPMTLPGTNQSPSRFSRVKASGHRFA